MQYHTVQEYRLQVCHQTLYLSIICCQKLLNMEVVLSNCDVNFVHELESIRRILKYTRNAERLQCFCAVDVRDKTLNGKYKTIPATLVQIQVIQVTATN